MLLDLKNADKPTLGVTPLAARLDLRDGGKMAPSLGVEASECYRLVAAADFLTVTTLAARLWSWRNDHGFPTCWLRPPNAAQASYPVVLGGTVNPVSQWRALIGDVRHYSGVLVAHNRLAPW